MTDARDITITAEIPLGAYIDRRIVSYDEDGDPTYDRSDTILDAIIAGLVNTLKEDLLRAFAGRYGSGVGELYDKKLREHVSLDVFT